VDDDAPVGEILGAQLRQAGYDCQVVTSGAQALEALERRPFAMVLSDLQMPRMDGRALLAEIGARWPHVPVALVSAYGTVSVAVEAMKAGAVDFVQKPFDRAELLYVVGKVLETRSAASTLSKPASRAGADGLDSEGLRELRTLIARVAPGSGAVLVRGEPGTEKALVARAIHDTSPRAAKSFVTVRCAAFSDELLERELFGYEKGAFVGAAQSKPGRAELAEGGTLFLDEIGSIPLPIQVRLVHLLAEREIERVGATRSMAVDVRIVAATHADLGALVAAGAFREDLYYRLNVVPIEIPPLRARPRDIDAIASRLATEHAASGGQPVTFSSEALACLRAQPWANNVPELHAFVERLLILHEGATLEADEVESALSR
jgi:two-component system response regulator AtoC